MDISQLRTLIRVAELGSLSKAADSLCLAQPALSRQVRMLEAELGTRLFDRHGRGMVVTEQGKTVMAHALRILKEVDAIKADVIDETDAFGGHVSIGMPPTVSTMLAVPLLAAIHEAHPNAKCRIFSGYSLYLLERIYRGEIDIGILYDPQAIISLKCEPLLEEDFHVIAPADSSLSPHEPVPFASLAGKPLLLPSSNHGLRQIVEQCAQDCGISLDVRVEVDSYSTLLHLVMNGYGWTILPLAPVLSHIASSQLSGAPLVDPVPRRLLQLSLPADRPASRLVSFVRQAMIATTSRLVADGSWAGKLARRRVRA